MAFLHSDIGQIPSVNTEPTDEARNKLESFRSKVRSARHVKFWSSADDLAGKVALSFNQFVRQYPATGWVRANKPAALELLTEAAALRKRIAELEAQEKDTAHNPPEGTSELAQGSDTIALNGSVKGSYGKQGSASIRTDVSLEASWGSILRVIGTRMLDEVEQDDLLRLLQSSFGGSIDRQDVEDKLVDAIEAAHPADEEDGDDEPEPDDERAARLRLRRWQNPRIGHH